MAIKRKNLNNFDFDLAPIWMWDDSREYKIPFEANSKHLIGSDICFVKSRFYANGYQFDGYLVWDGGCYAFTMFVNHESFKFNVNAKSLNKESGEKVFKALGCHGKFFPVHFESDVILNNEKIFGVIDFE